MIKTFRCRENELLFNRCSSKRFHTCENVARRKLRQLNASAKLQDMAIPPGNCLETLKGNRKGQYSVRVNDRWRICLTWCNGDPYDVEIVDYH